MLFLDRTRTVTPSPITEAHNWLDQRSGSRPLIDLSQAAPGYAPPAAVIDRVKAVADDPTGGFYCPTAGLPELKSVFANELSRDYQTSISPEQILPTGGCNQAFCVASSTLAAPGDEVILAVPYYFNHDMWLKLDGVKVRYLKSDSGTGLPDIEHAQALLSERSRAIVLVSPGNPTGTTLPAELLGEFYDLAVEHNLTLILDETYRNFRPTNDRPHSLYDDPSWRDHAVFLHSFSKDLAIPGYRVGAIVGGEAFLIEAMKLLDCVQISPPRIGQEAVVAGLTQSGDWRPKQAARILENLTRFRDVMASAPGGFRLISSGAFFGWVHHPFSDLASSEVVRRLVLEHDVLAIPGTAFTPTDQAMLRFSFANLEPEQFPVLAQRLQEMA